MLRRKLCGAVNLRYRFHVKAIYFIRALLADPSRMVGVIG
jgi:hypothetical protein